MGCCVDEGATAKGKPLLTRANSLESPPPWALAMVSTGGPLTVDGTGWEVWLQVVVMSRGRRWPCYLAEMDGGFYNGPGPRCSRSGLQLATAGTLIADAQDPGEAQAKPVRGWLDR